MVVLIQLQALHGVIAREAERIKLSENVLIQRAVGNDCLFRTTRRFRYLTVPRVGPHNRNGEALRGVGGQQTTDQVPDGLADASWATVFCSQYLFVQGCRVLVLKRQISTYHSKEDDAARP